MDLLGAARLWAAAGLASGGIAGAAIALVLYYMWLPEEGYTPEKGFVFRPKNDSSFIGRIKEKLSGISGIFASASKHLQTKISRDNNEQKLMAEKQQPYSFSQKDSSKLTVSKMAENVFEQLKEHGKANEKPNYNYHKKQRWSND